MIREFTTNFEFHGKTYSTQVYMSLNKRDFVLKIEVPDQSLSNLLPDGKVVYSSTRGLQLKPDREPLLTQELVGCIVRSIEPHLDC